MRWRGSPRFSNSCGVVKSTGEDLSPVNIDWICKEKHPRSLPLALEANFKSFQKAGRLVLWPGRSAAARGAVGVFTELPSSPASAAIAPWLWAGAHLLPGSVLATLLTLFESVIAGM